MVYGPDDRLRQDGVGDAIARKPTYIIGICTALRRRNDRISSALLHGGVGGAFELRCGCAEVKCGGGGRRRVVGSPTHVPQHRATIGQTLTACPRSRNADVGKRAIDLGLSESDGPTAVVVVGQGDRDAIATKFRVGCGISRASVLSCSCDIAVIVDGRERFHPHGQGVAEHLCVVLTGLRCGWEKEKDGCKNSDSTLQYHVSPPEMKSTIVGPLYPKPLDTRGLFGRHATRLQILENDA